MVTNRPFVLKDDIYTHNFEIVCGAASNAATIQQGATFNRVYTVPILLDKAVAISITFMVKDFDY